MKTIDVSNKDYAILPVFQSEAYMKICFIHMQSLIFLRFNKTIFHVKCFVLSLALKQVKANSEMG